MKNKNLTHRVRWQQFIHMLHSKYLSNKICTIFSYNHVEWRKKKRRQFFLQPLYLDRVIAWRHVTDVYICGFVLNSRITRERTKSLLCSQCGKNAWHFDSFVFTIWFVFTSYQLLSSLLFCTHIRPHTL